MTQQSAGAERQQLIEQANAAYEVRQMPRSAEEWKQRLADLERSGQPMSLQDEYEAARRLGGEAWKHLSPEFKARHMAEKKAKDGELYWYGINRAADARAKVLASVLRIKHEHV